MTKALAKTTVKTAAPKANTPKKPGQKSATENKANKIKEAAPASEAGENIQTLKTKFIARPAFNQTIGSRVGNRMKNFNSLHAGNAYTPESVAALEAGNFYNPRDLGGKKHNPKNVAAFPLEVALTIQAALSGRPDVLAVKLFHAGENRRSVWAAFAQDNQ